MLIKRNFVKSDYKNQKTSDTNRENVIATYTVDKELISVFTKHSNTKKS